MSGTTILVTGATAGIGLATAQALAGQGACVYITGRDSLRGSQAEARLRTITGNEQVHFLQAEHATVGGNQDLADRLAERCEHLNVLVNNVGGAPYADRQETVDGYERTLGTNFVGPAALTWSLLPLLRTGAPARVVNIVSSAFSMWKDDPFHDLQSAERFVMIKAYGHAKLLNLLWTFALARDLKDVMVTANAVNPGMAWTPGVQALTPDAVPAWRFVWPLVRFIQRRASPENAAKAPVMLASDPDLGTVTGKYFESKGKPAGRGKIASDETSQDRAFELAAQLIAQAPTSQTR